MKKLLLIAFFLISVKLFSQATQTVLLNDDFGFGPNVALPAGTINSGLCYNNQVSRACPPGVDVTNPYFDRLTDNQYVVTKAINPSETAWFDFRDHTSNGLNPDGRFLAVNNGASVGINGKLYSEKLYNIIPNENIFVEFYVANLLNTSFIGGTDPSFAFEIRTSTGVPITQVPQLPSFSVSRSNTWQLKQITINPGSVATPYLVFSILSTNIAFNGNEAVFDDIKIFQNLVLKIVNSIFDLVAIYPNPTKNLLYIDNIELDQISVYNNLGALIKEFKTNNELKNQIDLSNFSKGFYFIKLEKNQNSVLKKIVVN